MRGLLSSFPDNALSVAMVRCVAWMMEYEKPYGFHYESTLLAGPVGVFLEDSEAEIIVGTPLGDGVLFVLN